MFVRSDTLFFEGGCVGDYSHQRVGPSDQWSDGGIPPEVPTVQVGKDWKETFVY